MIITNHDIAVLCQFEPPTLISPQVVDDPKDCVPGDQEEAAPRDLTESAPEDLTESAPPPGDLPESNTSDNKESMAGDPGKQLQCVTGVSLSNLRL